MLITRLVSMSADGSAGPRWPTGNFLSHRRNPEIEGHDHARAKRIAPAINHHSKKHAGAISGAQNIFSISACTTCGGRLFFILPALSSVHWTAIGAASKNAAVTLALSFLRPVPPQCAIAAADLSKKGAQMRKNESRFAQRVARSLGARRRWYTPGDGRLDGHASGDQRRRSNRGGETAALGL